MFVVRRELGGALEVDLIGVEIWVHFEVWEGNRRCGWVIAFAEKGLLSEVVFYGDLRIIIDEIGSSMSVSLLFVDDC